MSPVGNSFCILTANDESYVQCAGAKSKLTIEYRKYMGRKFSHYVLGTPKEEKKEVSIRYSGGYIKVKQNEVLTNKDDEILPNCFARTYGVEVFTENEPSIPTD